MAGERETLLALLGYQRQSVVRKVTGVSEAEGRRSPVPTGTSLVWLVRHLAQAESTWVERRFAGRPAPSGPEPGCSSDTIEAAVAAYRDTWARVDSIVSVPESLDELSADTGTESPVSLRWVLGHLLEETARHAGHADILRELIDGETGR